MKNKTLFIWVLLLTWTSVLVAQDTHSLKPIPQLVQDYKKVSKLDKIDLFEFSTNDISKTAISEFVENANVLKVNSDLQKKLLDNPKATLAINIPSDWGMLALELIQHQVIAPDFVLTAQTDKGKSTLPFTDGLHYQGIVKGYDNSLVTLSIFEEEIIGSIHFDAYQLTLAPLLNNSKNKDKEYVLYENSQLKNNDTFECYSDNVPFNNIQSNFNFSIPTNSIPDSNRCVRVYFECDYQMYLDRGMSVNNVANYVTSAYNQVKSIYQNESINTIISEINVWSVLDPYPSSSSLNALISFRTNLAGNFNGDLAHLLSTKPAGNGGVAYLNVLCNANYACAYSNIHNSFANYPNYSWTVMVIAHEIGHNLGSPHTHACAWNGNNTAIDGCGTIAGDPNGCNGPLPNAGTVMSYCHLFSNIGIDLGLGFGPQPGDLIRSKVYNASCLSSCGPTCPINQTLIGLQVASNQKYEVHQNITAYTQIFPFAQNIIYDAGNEVVLRPNFHARKGCDFVALIDGCGGAYKTEADTWETTDLSYEFSTKNYPNPFSHHTTIEFSLGKADNVQLSVFDVSGKEIERLIDNVQYEQGTHQIDFDGSHLQSGMYFYSISTSDEKQTNKLMIMR